MSLTSFLRWFLAGLISIYLAVKGRIWKGGKNKPKRAPEDRILEQAPYIFPYLFDRNRVHLKYRDERIIVDAELDERKMIDYGYFDTVSGMTLGVINFFTYFKEFSPHKFCCFSKPYKDQDQQLYILRFSLFDVEALKPLTSKEESGRDIKSKDLPFLFNGPSDDFYVPTTLELGLHHFDYPESFAIVDELIVFGNKSNLYPEKPAGVFWSEHILIICSPLNSTIELIALDWFNKGSYDFGYVWPVRIARNPADQMLYGEGIRMHRFIMDSTGKSFVKFLY